MSYRVFVVLLSVLKWKNGDPNTLVDDLPDERQEWHYTMYQTKPSHMVDVSKHYFRQRLLGLGLIVVLSYFKAIPFLLLALSLWLAFIAVRSLLKLRKSPSPVVAIAPQFQQGDQTTASKAKVIQVNAALLLVALSGLLVELNKYMEIYEWVQVVAGGEATSSKGSKSKLVYETQSGEWTLSGKLPTRGVNWNFASATSSSFEDNAAFAWPLRLDNPGVAGIFDRKGLRWKPETYGGQIPAARVSPAISSQKNYILAWGGYRQTPSGSHLLLHDGGLLDLETKQWVALKLPGEPRNALASSASFANGYIQVVSTDTFTGSGTKIQIDRYSIKKQRWLRTREHSLKVRGEYALLPFGSDILIFPSTIKKIANDPLQSLPAGSFLQKTAKFLLDLAGESHDATVKGYNQKRVRSRNQPVLLLRLSGRNAKFSVSKAPSILQSSSYVKSFGELAIAANENGELILCKTKAILCQLPNKEVGGSYLLRNTGETIATYANEAAFVWMPEEEHILVYNFSTKVTKRLIPAELPQSEMRPVLFKIGKNAFYLSGKLNSMNRGSAPFDQWTRKKLASFCSSDSFVDLSLLCEPGEKGDTLF